MMIPLDVCGIHKEFRKKAVLHDISFSVREGEVFGLIGSNGVGKTTLIKIILDLLDASQGKISFFGIPHTITASRKNISYLPEKFSPSPFLKGHEFLSLALSFLGKKFDYAKAKEQARFFDLDPQVLDHRLGKYSKGMGQKLGLLSVFMSEAPLLILDEPMSGLDPSARIKLKDMLKNYGKHGKTVFFTSHILSDIEEICNRIAVLDKGKIIFVGSPQEFMVSYQAETLERAFLNAINTEEMRAAS
jgi:ABC-2 type transport system ATP-binding protein